MSTILAILVLVIPVIHLWFHALLPWWRKNPPSFYLFSVFLILGVSFVVTKLSAISPSMFLPGKNEIIAGYGLIAIGLFGGLFSIFSLGVKRFFLWAVFYPDSVAQIRIRQFVPHPAYLGYILVALGNVFISGKFYLLGILIWAFILTPIVIWLEEQELQKRVG